tara:strand:+ start:114 stop:608 length:495 start_codon:yes stop_codon:yes gene_type:complete
LNLRQKFFWNVLIFIFFINGIFVVWSLLDIRTYKKEVWNNFTNEEIGTDEKLQSKVKKLENNITDRKLFSFKLKENPTDLTNVLSLGDDFKYGIGSRGMRVTTYTSASNPKIVINYKNKNYTVQVNDSIAGGVIKKITPTKVIFLKNNEEKILPVPNLNKKNIN